MRIHGPWLWAKRARSQLVSGQLSTLVGRRGLASRNLLFAAGVSGGLIALMLLKQNHEKWMRAASGVAVTVALLKEQTPAGKADEAALLSTDDAAGVSHNNTYSTSPAGRLASIHAVGSGARNSKEETLTAEQRLCRDAMNRGKAFLAERRANNAVVLLRKATELDPTCAEAHYHLGLAYSLQGDMEAARAQSDVLEALDPSLASLLRNLAR